jgi:hypothetical protein
MSKPFKYLSALLIIGILIILYVTIDSRIYKLSDIENPGYNRISSIIRDTVAQELVNTGCKSNIYHDTLWLYTYHNQLQLCVWKIKQYRPLTVESVRTCSSKLLKTEEGTTYNTFSVEDNRITVSAKLKFKRSSYYSLRFNDCDTLEVSNQLSKSYRVYSARCSSIIFSNNDDTYDWAIGMWDAKSILKFIVYAKNENPVFILISSLNGENVSMKEVIGMVNFID